MVMLDSVIVLEKYSLEYLKMIGMCLKLTLECSGKKMGKKVTEKWW